MKNKKNKFLVGVNIGLLTLTLITPGTGFTQENPVDGETSIEILVDDTVKEEKFSCQVEELKTTVETYWNATMTQKYLFPPNGDVTVDTGQGKNRTRARASFSTVDPTERIPQILDGIKPFLNSYLARQLEVIKAQQSANNARQEIIDKTMKKVNETIAELDAEYRGALDKYIDLEPGSEEAIKLISEYQKSIFEKEIETIENVFGPNGILQKAFPEQDITNPLLPLLIKMLGATEETIIKGKISGNDEYKEFSQVLKENCTSRVVEDINNIDIKFTITQDGRVEQENYVPVEPEQVYTYKAEKLTYDKLSNLIEDPDKDVWGDYEE